MQNRLPERVNPFNMADSSRRLSGQVPAGKLKRLANLLDTTDTSLAIELAFGIGEQGTRTVSGIVRGELLLTCQRCLGRMRFLVDINFTLALARSLEQTDLIRQQLQLAGSLLAEDMPPPERAGLQLELADLWQTLPGQGQCR